MIRRRTFLSLPAAAALVALPKSSFGQGADGEALIDAFPPLPADQVEFADQPDVSSLDLEVDVLGTATPNAQEIALAGKILSAAPHDTTPLAVARYFQEIGQGLRPAALASEEADLRPFVRGWPKRYNPVIINFFKATRTNPLALDGDFTSWCAAFINWCIARAASKTADIALDSKGLMAPFDDALLALGTASASSGSFRCWPKEGQATDSPQPGDIVVWAIEGSVNGCAIGKGHVGFYAGTTAEGRFRTLGGNQKDPATKHFAVVEKAIGKSFPRGDGKVEFHSIRKMS